MKLTVLRVLLLYLAIWVRSYSTQTCYQDIHIQGGGSAVVSSPNYPHKYAPGSSCKYKIHGPSEYELHFDCNIDLYKRRAHGDCSQEVLYMDYEDPQLLPDSHFYCGYGRVKRRSKSNVVNIKYFSSSNHGGRFSCTITSSLRRCFCGWGVAKRSVLTGYKTYSIEFPSVVGVVDFKLQQIVCQATIVHSSYLLSVAHCYASDKSEQNYRLLLGSRKDKVGSTLHYRISEIIRHEDFEEETRINDIALLKTDHSLQWSSALGPACLPFHVSRSETIADVAGWDWKLLDTDHVSHNLLKTTYNLLNDSACKDITHKTWCAKASRTTLCERDPGTPVFHRDGLIYVFGLVSSVDDCDTNRQPVIVDVFSYLDWIVQKVPELSVCN